jgi:hypothetical protein
MRRQIQSHPVRTLAGLLVVAFALFMISGIPSVKNAKGWSLADVVGYISWFGFLLTFLAFLVTAGYLAVRGARSRRTA